ncbi:hypothetical protein P3S67_023243 [Capsicum chacoense]
MSQASQSSNSKNTLICHCGNATDNGVCSFFKWLDELSPPSSPSTFISGLETSNFKGLAKFNQLQRFQQCEENKDFLMTSFKEAEEQRNHFKLLLHDTQIERDQLK